MDFWTRSFVCINCSFLALFTFSNVVFLLHHYFSNVVFLLHHYFSNVVFLLHRGSQNKTPWSKSHSQLAIIRIMSEVSNLPFRYSSASMALRPPTCCTIFTIRMTFTYITHRTRTFSDCLWQKPLNTKVLFAKKKG